MNYSAARYPFVFEMSDIFLRGFSKPQVLILNQK